jgi:hypothetical protein
MELVDAVCKNFEDYAQAKTKSSGEPVIIRSGGLQAFRFWIRFRIWIRIQHKMKYKSQINNENNFLGNNAASYVKKGRLCKFFYCAKFSLDPVPEIYPELELQ